MKRGEANVAREVYKYAKNVAVWETKYELDKIATTEPKPAAIVVKHVAQVNEARLNDECHRVSFPIFKNHLENLIQELHTKEANPTTLTQLVSKFSRLGRQGKIYEPRSMKVLHDQIGVHMWTFKDVFGFEFSELRRVTKHTDCEWHPSSQTGVSC
jgi:hypothetical protein